MFTLLGISCQNSPSKLILKFGHVGAPGSLFEISAREFASRANARLGEMAEVVVFGSSQLGGDASLLQKLKLGTVDMALPSTIMSSVVDEFGLFEMPYLVRDRNHMMRIEKEIFWPHLAPLAEVRGYQVLAVWENGFRHITNNTRPIVEPEDLKGIKLRTPRSIWRIKMFQNFGANPTPMALSEVFMALQTGVMDGQENPFAQIYSNKFQEVQKFLSLTGHVYTPAFLTVGKDKWAELPADIRQVLEETSLQLQEFVYQQAVRLEEDLLRIIKTSGVSINHTDRERFVEASQPTYEQFDTEVPEATKLIQMAISLASM